MAGNWYTDKLKHPNWQKKRLRIMDRAGFRCEICNSADITLHVHHGYYERGVDPWEYPDDTLYCICEECHRTVEANKLAIYKELGRVHPKRLTECLPALTKIRQTTF